MFKATVTALVAVATCLAAPAAAQTQSQIDQALGNFTRAQQALGANESCFVLEDDARLYADILVRQLQTQLQRAIGDTFDPEAIREDAREAFEGCASRTAAPEIWQSIDSVRDMGMIFTVGTSLISLDPSECVRDAVSPVTAADFDAVSALTLDSLDDKKNEQIRAIAANVVPMIEGECAKKPTFNYPSTMRPAIAKLRAFQHLRLLQGEAASSQLASLGIPQGSDRDPWIGAKRSRFTISRPLGEDYTEVTAWRTYDQKKAVASAHLRVGSTMRGNGKLYFTRDRLIAARMDGDYDAIVLSAVEGNRFYTLRRTNKGVKPDFFGENQAEFEMFESERDKFFRENDENTNFYISYRPTTKGSLKPFIKNGSERRAMVNMGDLVRGYLWAMAPSAIDQ